MADLFYTKLKARLSTLELESSQAIYDLDDVGRRLIPMLDSCQAEKRVEYVAAIKHLASFDDQLTVLKVVLVDLLGNVEEKNISSGYNSSYDLQCGGDIMEFKFNSRMTSLKQDVEDVKEYLAKIRELLVNQAEGAKHLVAQLLNIDGKDISSKFRQISEKLEMRDCLVTHARQELYNWNKSAKQTEDNFKKSNVSTDLSFTSKQSTIDKSIKHSVSISQRITCQSTTYQNNSRSSYEPSQVPTKTNMTNQVLSTKNFQPTIRDKSTENLASLSKTDTDFFMLNVAKSLGKTFGLYSESLGPDLVYPEFNILFEEGSPAMFWLHINTSSVVHFQQHIQRKLKGKLGDGGGDLQPGSLVLARYKLDGFVYRAKVEYINNVDGEFVVGVRYIDYGNSSVILSKEDLYIWDPLLEFVPAQAVLCTFHQAPTSFKSKTLLTLEDTGTFVSLMSGVMKLNVHKRLHSIPMEVFNTDDTVYQTPELEITLTDKSGLDVLYKISINESFRKYFGDTMKPSKTLIEKHNYDQCFPFLPSTQESLSEIPVPEPIHLTEENLVKVELDHDQVVLADITPSIPSGLPKVSSWLDRYFRDDCHVKHSIIEANRVVEPNITHQSTDTYLTKRKDLYESLDKKVQRDNGDETSLEAISSSSRANSNLQVESQSTRNSRQNFDVHSPTCFTTPLLESDISLTKHKTDNFKSQDMRSGLLCDQCKTDISEEDVLNCSQCSDFKICKICQESRAHHDLHHPLIIESIPPVNLPPTLEQQPLPDKITEFQFLLSHVENPGEFYVHPVLETTALLASIEIIMETVNLINDVSTHNVKIGSVYVISCDQMFYRVKIKSVESDQTVVKSVDYGFVLNNIPCSSLLSLPPGLPSDVPGLAVRIRLALLSPYQGGWSKKSIDLFTNLVDLESVHTAAVVPDYENSVVGAIITVQNNLVVNKILVEEDCAQSPYFVKKRNNAVKYGDVWDPMCDDYQTTSNNYLTNDDDLEIATSGYKTRIKVCPFYLNKGSCYKGDYCIDRHEVPREGAVTTDRKEVILDMQLMLTLPSVNSIVLVKVTEVLTPSLFYLNFPQGTQDISNQNPSDFTKKLPFIFSQFEQNLQKHYDGHSKRLLLSSFPSPGEIIVACSERDRKWHRARVLAGCSLSDNMVEIFFVDFGYKETVELRLLRRLDLTFRFLPCQAVSACLFGVKPSTECWTDEAITFFQKQVTAHLLMTAQVVSNSPDEPLLVHLSPRLGLNDDLHFSIAQLMVEKEWALNVTANGQRGVIPE